MAKFRPNQGQKKVLSALAHCMLAQEFDRNVDDMKGFFEYYINAPENREVKGIWDAFKAEAKKVRKDFIAEMDKDKDFRGTAGG